MDYSEYLCLNKILDAQKPKGQGESDELLFIIVHQVYELWFKLTLNEFEKLSVYFTSGQQTEASLKLTRIIKIWQTLIGQVNIIETMGPLDFNVFRKYLGNASGFQSWQFRLLEFKLGCKKERILKNFPDNKLLEKAYSTPSIYEDFITFLKIKSLIPNDSQKLPEHLLNIYKQKHSASLLCENMLDISALLQEWRYRHIQMVKRMIGSKPGTGGSSGAKYLSTTLEPPVFPDLWAVRNLI